MPKHVALDPGSIATAVRLASEQGGVVSRRQLYAAGVTRWQVVANVRARRWQTVGDQSVCVHTGPLTREGHWWAAVFQGGPRACLDGAAALAASGLEQFTVERIRVSVPRGARIRRTATLRHPADPPVGARRTRCPAGVPRTKPAVAAVRAALWARSDRQAALVLTHGRAAGAGNAERARGTSCCGSGATSVALLLHALVLRPGRRRPLARRAGRRCWCCGERGLPEPDRQVLQEGRARPLLPRPGWDAWKLVVEIDGIHHTWAENVVGDALRQNSLVLQGDTVLRLPLLGLRLRPDEFFAQIEDGLRRAGFDARRAA